MNKQKLLCKDCVHHFWSLTVKQRITGILLFIIHAGELGLFDALELILQSQKVSGILGFLLNLVIQIFIFLMYEDALLDINKHVFVYFFSPT